MLAQAVTLLVSIWEVCGANVGYTTDHPEWHLSQLLSPPTDKHWDSTLNDTFLSTSFQFISPYHPAIMTLHNIKLVASDQLHVNK